MACRLQTTSSVPASSFPAPAPSGASRRSLDMRTLHRFWLALFVPLCFALITGCGRSTETLAPGGSSATAVDQAAVGEELAAHPDMVDDQGLSEPGDQTGASGSGTASMTARGAGTAGIASPIHPLFFFRTIRDI